VVFSALHLQFQGFLPRMFLGVILGALYWYSGSLWTSILAHFVNNAIQVIAVSYSPKYVNDNPSVPVLYALISGVAVFAILWGYKKYSHVSYAKVYEMDEADQNNQFLV
jgi:membrane protease YdiL (CAAX protease family)